MNFLFNFLIGISIGAGAIIPGVSSGVFCVIFGIYEKLVDSIINFFKDIKNNFLFLFPIGMGAFLGIVLLGNIIKYIFSTFKMQSCFIFMGLILGTIPSLFKEANHNKSISIKELFAMLISFIIGISLIILENKLNITFDSQLSATPFYLILAGFIMSIGIIVPGISNTVLLMCLGVYSTYISAIASVNLSILIPIGIGILLGSIIWLNIINYLLKKYYSTTFFCIIGFTLGSLLVLYPGLTFDIYGALSIVLFIISIILSYKLSYKK